MRRRRSSASMTALAGRCFNSRLREEATFALDVGLLVPRGFNSRLREEATALGDDTGGSDGCFNSRLREEATEDGTVHALEFGFQLTPP